MHAIHIDDNRDLQWTEMPSPTMGDDQVRISVKAAALNRADILQRKGLYPVPPGASPILGLEAAGVIAECGNNVEGWKVGDRVCVLLEGGGYADEVVADASMLLPIPANLNFAEAAALPEVLYTAYLNIWLEGEAMPGEKVLIHAGASGVGTAAIQLCKALGNPCYATASAGKLDRLKQLGVSGTVPRDGEPWLDRLREVAKGGVDVILDPVGGAYLDQNIQALNKRGRLVNIGLLAGRTAELNMGRVLMNRIRIVGSVLRSRSREEKVAITERLLDTVWPHIEARRIVPVIDSEFAIQDAAAAHDRLATNKTVGKVILNVS